MSVPDTGTTWVGRSFLLGVLAGVGLVVLLLAFRYATWWRK